MSQEPTQQCGIPRSGRGKQLTPSEEAALISICQTQRGEQDLGNHTKSFWKSLSTELQETTGRVYSWQSCRRRMLAWETDRLAGSPGRAQSPGPGETGHAATSTSLRRNERSSAHSRPANPPHLSNTSFPSNGQFANRQETDQLPFLHSPFRNQGSIANWRMAPTAETRNHEVSASRDGDFDDDTDDEFLPETPIRPLQRSLPTGRETENPCAEILAMFENSVIAFEAQLQCFTGAVLKDKEDREGVTEAFHFFREEVDRVIKKHSR